MTLSTARLKFLDVINYLAAGTSLLNAFYKGVKVETMKQVFKASGPPSREEIYSTLVIHNRRKS